MTFVIAMVGTLASVLFTVVELYVRVYLPRAKTKRIRRRREKENLEEQKNGLNNTIWQFEQRLKELQENNLSSDVLPHDLPNHLVEKVRIFNERHKVCADFFEACNYAIRLILMDKYEETLPKTASKYNLDVSLRDSDFIKMYVNGEEVTKRWIEKTYPTRLYAEMLEHLQEPENKLDEFFLKINTSFQSNRIMKRYRQERNELEKLGKEIIQQLKEEVESINRQLSNYAGLED